jgi:hypothetical protein
MPLKFLYDIIVTKITLTKIVLVANAHAASSYNARPAFEMTAIALPARYALKPQLLNPYDDNSLLSFHCFFYSDSQILFLLHAVQVNFPFTRASST